MEDIKKYLREFTYVSPIWEDLLEQYMLIEVVSNYKEINCQIEIFCYELEELGKMLKRIVSFSSEVSDFDVDIYIYDKLIFSLKQE